MIFIKIPFEIGDVQHCQVEAKQQYIKFIKTIPYKHVMEWWMISSSYKCLRHVQRIYAEKIEISVHRKNLLFLLCFSVNHEDEDGWYYCDFVKETINKPLYGLWTLCFLIWSSK